MVEYQIRQIDLLVEKNLERLIGKRLAVYHPGGEILIGPVKDIFRRRKDGRITVGMIIERASRFRDGVEYRYKKVYVPYRKDFEYWIVSQKPNTLYRKTVLGKND